MYHPGRGAARRLGPCLRAYQARPQDRLSARALPLPPLWPLSAASPPPPLLRPALRPCPPRLPQAPRPPAPQAQALGSLWEEGPGPELHGGCLDGLRSLFERPPCPCPGALVPFQAPGAAHPPPATPSGDPGMEEHLAVMYERLRHELPTLLLHSHDYTLYSADVEFINEGPGLVRAVSDPLPLHGLELLCTTAAGGPAADPPPRELDAAGPLAPRGAARAHALPALLQARQGRAVPDLRRLLHLLPEFQRPHLPPPPGQADAVALAPDAREEAAGGSPGGAGAGARARRARVPRGLRGLCAGAAASASPPLPTLPTLWSCCVT
ncbi:uncharacterized protein C6orf136 homolog isoform X2 [Dasypus novemcinctus]|uniref:uncharacterized protein C6orf136 homolog isoform X2 n=1 Tax=Dasypus novemcinctus TaxID=9361 RepID=UPI00266004AF|nr:uncharacterized protein C6orf136 homolog isoform X2 [Dasypus novemcinctus]